MTPPKPDGVIRQLRLPLAAIVVLFTYGVSGYVLFGAGILDAIQQTALVVTTVGFAPRGAPSLAERVFTASIALMGVGIFLALLGLFTNALAEGRVGLASRRKRMERRIDRMQGHYIVCAYGRVGRAIARELEAEGKDFVVIDRLDDLEDIMRSDGVTYLIGDPSQEGLLRAAGIERARALVSAVDSDADNVYIVLTARSLAPDLFIVARASERPAADRLYRAGANRVVSPYVSSGRHMASLAMRPGVLDYIEIAGREDRPMRMEEVVIDTASPFVGRSLAEVCGGSFALLLRREDGTLLPNPDLATDVRVGDQVILLGTSATLRAAERST